MWRGLVSGLALPLVIVGALGCAQAPNRYADDPDDRYRESTTREGVRDSVPEGVSGGIGP